MTMHNDSASLKRWNVMVYLATDNNLSEHGVRSLKEMQRIGSAEDVEVTARFYSCAEKTGPLQYRIRKQTPEEPAGDRDGRLTSFPIRPIDRRPQFPTPEGSDPAVSEVVEFITSSIEQSEANAAKAHHLLIFSGHADGAVGRLLKSNGSRPSLKVGLLSEVFEAVKQCLNRGSETGDRNLDLVVMDSCLMSMAEVATELSGKVDYLIGAEGYELNLGWPYHRVMEALNRASREGITPRALTGQLVNDYVRYYSDYVIAGVSVDQAACDLNRAPDLNNAVRWLKDELIEGLEESAILDAVIVAHWRAQSYHAEQYVDLWDFCDHLSRSRACRQNEGLLKACRSVKEIIEGRESEGIQPFVLKSRYCGAAFQHSHGVSIYFPWAIDTADVKDFENLRQYAQLKFHQETGWGTFLEEYLVRSRLPIRNQELHPNDPPLYFITPDDRRTVVRTNTPDLRTNYPELRGGGNPVAKVKNPPLGFYPESDE